VTPGTGLYHDFDVTSPEEISYYPPEIVVRRTRLLLRWVVPVSAGIVLGSLAFVIPYAIWAGFNDTVLVWVIVVLAGFSGLIIGGVTVLHSPPTIEHGVLTYASRRIVAINRRTAPTNRFPLKDVLDVKVNINVHKEYAGDAMYAVLKEGLELYFPGGIRIWLEESDFRGSGMAILEKIARLHGISYIEETKKILLGPNRPRFRVFNAQRLDGEILIFEKTIPAYTLISWKSDGKTKRMAPQDILWIEPVRTQYAGDCYLVNRTDGIRFLVPASELEGLRLQERAAWRLKFTTSENPRFRLSAFEQ